MRQELKRGWDGLVLDAGVPGKPQLDPFAATNALEARPVFSHNGRFIAYVSNEKKKDHIEVYVRAYPGPSTAWQVSTDGGD